MNTTREELVYRECPDSWCGWHGEEVIYWEGFAGIWVCPRCGAENEEFTY